MEILFPAFINPTATVLLLLIPYLVVPVAIIVLIVWFVRKMNSIDKTLREISDKLKSNINVD